MGTRDLEVKYGVRIADDALSFADRLLRAYENAPSLRCKEAIHLVEGACRGFSAREERLLDWDEYCLDRAFVELTELRREKSVACRTDVLPRVEEEVAELTRKWDCFTNMVVASQRHRSRKRRDVLRRLRDELTNFTKEGMAAHLPPLLDQLQQTVHTAFVEKLVVGPREVAQEASKLTGLAETLFYPPFQIRATLQIEDLKARLSNRMIELDGLIHKIGHALSLSLSEQQSVLGSFLLVIPYHGALFGFLDALAEEIYGDKDRCTHLEQPHFKDSHLVSTILRRLESSRGNGCVVVFHTFDKLPALTSELLRQIIKDGILAVTDTQQSFNFSDSIIIASYVPCDRAFFDCQCLQTTIPKLPLPEILRDPALLHEGIRVDSCRVQHLCTWVTNEYSSNFLDLFNDLLVYPSLSSQNASISLQNRMAITRLQIRNTALTFLKKEFILYPSDAAVVYIAKMPAIAYEYWYLDYMLPWLLKHHLDSSKEAGKMTIIYIDLLVGLGEKVSFRAENIRHLQKFTTHNRYKESLSTLRSIYRRGKLQSQHIHSLRTRCSHLCNEKNEARALSESKEALILIDRLLTQHRKKVRRDYFIPEAEICKKWQLRQSKSPAASILCLGLRPKSKEQLATSLEDLLFMDDEEQLMLIQVDLSQDAGSFFQCRTDTNELLTEAVKTYPKSVIVFHQLEMARMSVFSTILSILDFGVAEDSAGNVTSFEDCTVVIISDLGNKEIISRLIKDSRMEDKSYQKEVLSLFLRATRPRTRGTTTRFFMPNNVPLERGFRYELLYRLDHLLLFDPFSHNQFNQRAMLPIKALNSHLTYAVFNFLLNNADEGILDHIQGALGELIM